MIPKRQQLGDRLLFWSHIGRINQSVSFTRLLAGLLNRSIQKMAHTVVTNPIHTKPLPRTYHIDFQSSRAPCLLLQLTNDGVAGVLLDDARLMELEESLRSVLSSEHQDGLGSSRVVGEEVVHL